jgi:nucleoside 2-deoxyribosyltransferase
MKSVYLAGPITGLSYGGTTSWREYVKMELATRGIRGVSPMRDKAYLSKEKAIGDSYDQLKIVTENRLKTVLSGQRGIYTRDRYDCTHCDAIFANFLGATRVSIGSVIELGWANGHNIPIILAIEPEGNIHEHALVRECTGFRVETVNDGMDVVTSLLGAYE